MNNTCMSLAIRTGSMPGATKVCQNRSFASRGVLPEPCAHRASFCVFCVHQIHNA